MQVLSTTQEMRRGDSVPEGSSLKNPERLQKRKRGALKRLFCWYARAPYMELLTHCEPQDHNVNAQSLLLAGIIVRYTLYLL